LELIQQNGFDFLFDPNSCQNCPGYCCCGEPGKIWVNIEEIFTIATFLKMNIIDFINTYLYACDNQYTIKERYFENSYECIFFDNTIKKCSIYQVRPLQCQQYPFWKHFKKHKTKLSQDCPGIIKKHLAK